MRVALLFLLISLPCHAARLSIGAGGGSFTGGLGDTTNKTWIGALRAAFELSPAFALEVAAFRAGHIDTVVFGSDRLELDTTLIPVTAGIRVGGRVGSWGLEPHAVAGGGVYFRSQKGRSSSSGVSVNEEAGSGRFGAFAGAGLDFPLGKVVLLGLDARFHLVDFGDEESDLGGLAQPGGRAGDYVTSTLWLSFAL